MRDRVSGVPGITVVGPRRYGGRWFLEYLALARDALLMRGRFDGVEAHVLYPAGLIGLVVARLRGIPLVVYVHGGEARGVARRSRAYRWLVRLVGRRAAVIANSEDTARELASVGIRAEVIPPGVDLARFRPTPRPPERRVLYLGGTSRRKGYDMARRLADTLVGPGIRDVEPRDVPALMVEHDVVLVPSTAEPFGLVAAEAIASGRWVVASAVGGLREVVTDGVNGFLVEDGDFAGALARVPDYDPRAVAATAARFDLRHWQEGMEQVWQRVLDATDRGPATYHS